MHLLAVNIHVDTPVTLYTFQWSYCPTVHMCVKRTVILYTCQWPCHTVIQTSEGSKTLWLVGAAALVYTAVSGNSLFAKWM